MCLDCKNHFIIHNVEELLKYMRMYSFKNQQYTVALWLERGYITNLIYLEWKHENKGH